MGPLFKRSPVDPLPNPLLIPLLTQRLKNDFYCHFGVSEKTRPWPEISVCLQRRKSVHNHHRKKTIWRTFLASKKTFQAGGGYKNPIKTKKTISTTEIFPLCTPFFSAKKSSALEQGGVCLLALARNIYLSDFLLPLQPPPPPSRLL